MKLLMTNGFMVSFQNIDLKNPFDVNHLNVANEREGFLLDITCQGAEPLIESVSLTRNQKIPKRRIWF